MPMGEFINKDLGCSISTKDLGRNDTVSHSRGKKISTRLLSEIKTIIENAILLDTESSQKNTSKKHNETSFMHKLYAPIIYEGELYIAKVAVEEYGADFNKRFYNLRGIKIDLAGGIPDVDTSYDTRPDTRSVDSIADLYKFVKQFDERFFGYWKITICY